MAIKTQGTSLYFVDPDTLEVVAIGCVTGIDNVIGTPVQARDVTPVESEVEISEPGMFSPGQTDFSIKFDPADDSHNRILSIYQSRREVDFALGLSDGIGPPDVDESGEPVATDERSFLVFRGWFIDVPLSFALSEHVAADVSIMKTLLRSATGSTDPTFSGGGIVGYSPRSSGPPPQPTDCCEWTSARMKQIIEFEKIEDPPMPVEFDLQNCSDICFVEVTVKGEDHHNISEFPGSHLSGKQVLGVGAIPEEYWPETPKQVTLGGYWSSTNGYYSEVAKLEVRTDGSVMLHSNVDSNNLRIISDCGIPAGMNPGDAPNPPAFATHTLFWRLAGG